MNVLSSTNKQFTRAFDVEVPSYFQRRFKTGNEEVDKIFGIEGIVPNLTFTLAAAPGTGKTTFLLQTLELLEKTGKKTAYISGEETIEQLAYNSYRIGVKNVFLANLTNIDEICEEIVKQKFNVVVIDSFPTLTANQTLTKTKKEEYITSKLLITAKKHEIVLGVILHFTKTGSYKGSTLLPHSVDCNIIMNRNENNVAVRDFEVTKNRFGSCSYTSFLLNDQGFAFDSKLKTKDELAAVNTSIYF